MLEIDENTSYVCKQSFERFVGTGLYVGLFLMSILYVINHIKKENNKENKIKIILGIYSIIILALNINPVFTKLMIKVTGESDTYWRVYWLLPIGISIAYMFTEIVFMQNKRIHKILNFIVVVAIIILSGDFMYNSDNFTKVNNYYKVPDTAFDIICYISEEDDDYKKVAGPEVFSVYTRQVDGTILLGQGRKVSEVYGENSIIAYIENEDIENICEYCIKEKCNYLVLKQSTNLSEKYKRKYSINMLYSNEEYSLYKFENITK
jgi:hypothetical protein